MSPAPWEGGGGGDGGRAPSTLPGDVGLASVPPSTHSMSWRNSLLLGLRFPKGAMREPQGPSQLRAVRACLPFLLCQAFFLPCFPSAFSFFPHPRTWETSPLFRAALGFFTDRSHSLLKGQRECSNEECRKAHPALRPWASWDPTA